MTSLQLCRGQDRLLRSFSVQHARVRRHRGTKKGGAQTSPLCIRGSEFTNLQDRTNRVQQFPSQKHKQPPPTTWIHTNTPRSLQHLMGTAIQHRRDFATSTCPLDYRLNRTQDGLHAYMPFAMHEPAREQRPTVVLSPGRIMEEADIRVVLAQPGEYLLRGCGRPTINPRRQRRQRSHEPFKQPFHRRFQRDPAKLGRPFHMSRWHRRGGCSPRRLVNGIRGRGGSGGSLSHREQSATLHAPPVGENEV